jgi:hypothetical protein
MAAPTTIIITGSFPASPQTVTLRKPDGTNPEEVTAAVHNIFLNGGFWFNNNGVQTFAAWGTISSITAQ